MPGDLPAQDAGHDGLRSLRRSRSRGLPARKQGRCPAGHLPGRDILDVLAHHPLLAERITQPPAALPVKLVLKR